MFVEALPLTVNSGWSYCREDGMLFTLMWATFCAGHSGLKEMKLQRKALCLNLLCFGHFPHTWIIGKTFHLSANLPNLLCWSHRYTNSWFAVAALFKFQYLFISLFGSSSQYNCLVLCCAGESVSQQTLHVKGREEKGFSAVTLGAELFRDRLPCWVKVLQGTR